MAAQRSMAEAGLFSSWARPAESLPREIAGGEEAGAVDHGVNEDGGDFEALLSQRAQMGAGNGEDLEGLECAGVAGCGGEARERQQASDIAGPPLHDLVEAGAAINEEGEAAGEDDVEVFDLGTFEAEEFSGLEGAEGAVRGKPLELRAGCAAQSFVLREAVDEVWRGHRGSLFWGGMDRLLLRYQSSKRLARGSDRIAGGTGGLLCRTAG
jgi:hypothetical protein